MMGRIAVAALWAWLLCASGAARADDTHYNTFPIGERALGLGGAFTGFAEDTSAAYYNPAGLAIVGQDGVGGSLTINAFQRRIIEDGFALRAGDPTQTTDMRYRTRPAVPVSGGMIKRVGPRDEHGDRPMALALTAFVPTQRRLVFDAELIDAATRVRDSIVVDREDTEIWTGPSFALRVSDTLSLGVTAYLASHRLRHREDEVIVTEGVFDTATGTYQNATLFVRENLLQIDTQHLVFRVGTLWQATSALRLGLTLQAPGLELAGGARLRERRAFADTLAMPGYATFFESDQKGLGAASPIPFEARLGASLQAGENVLLAADLIFTAPVGSAGDPIRRFGDPEPADGDVPGVPEAGDFISQTYHRRPVVNAAVGMEALLGGVVPLRLGAFTDFSSAPDISRATDAFQADHLDQYGVTFGLGYRSGDYDFQIGVGAVFGFGTALGLNPGPYDTTPETYVPRDIRDRTILFFFSGAQRSATLLAKDVAANRQGSGDDEGEGGEPRDANGDEEAGAPAVDGTSLEEPE